MRVSMAGESAGRPGRVNEDFAGAVPGTIVLVDGAGIPGSGAVCRHGVAWYAARLGGTLLGLSAARPPRGLREMLAEAIERVTAEHRGTCRVADPIAPSASVAILRSAGGRAEYLVLGDAFCVLDGTGGPPLVVTDSREAAVAEPYAARLAGVAEGGEEYRRILGELRARRNRPGGFWVARDDPRAAEQAVTGSRPAAGLTTAALLSNGAARIVEPYGLTDWPGAMALLAAEGPGELIRRVRDAERRDGTAADDATAVGWTRPYED